MQCKSVDWFIFDTRSYWKLFFSWKNRSWRIISCCVSNSVSKIAYVNLIQNYVEWKISLLWILNFFVKWTPYTFRWNKNSHTRLLIIKRVKRRLQTRIQVFIYIVLYTCCIFQYISVFTQRSYKIIFYALLVSGNTGL